MSDKISWHQTVINYSKQVSIEKVHQCYFHNNPIEAGEAFLKSNEFRITLDIISPNLSGQKLLDIGAGNGIASYAFSKSGFQVTALEPDSSDLVGTKAIEKLNKLLDSKIQIVSSFAEQLPFDDESFDVIYCRQVLHHASDLDQFMSEISRVLKPNGVVFTARDHVISNENELQSFLNRHPLHKYYGGENAFTLEKYEESFLHANLKIERRIGPLSCEINYFPDSRQQVSAKIRGLLKPRMNPFMYYLTRFYSSERIIKKWGEEVSNFLHDPGKLYSYLLIKDK